MVNHGERRAALRWTPEKSALADVRIRAGAPAEVIDCSMAGIRLATSMRLMPGRRCTLAWPSAEGRPSVAGAVVRCDVGRLAAEGVRYHAAIQFDSLVGFLREADTPSG